jgi:hypothetical protein
VTLRARWVTLRARWVTLRASWVLFRLFEAFHARAARRPLAGSAAAGEARQRGAAAAAAAAAAGGRVRGGQLLRRRVWALLTAGVGRAHRAREPLVRFFLFLPCPVSRRGKT